MEMAFLNGDAGMDVIDAEKMKPVSFATLMAKVIRHTEIDIKRKDGRIT